MRNLASDVLEHSRKVSARLHRNYTRPSERRFSHSTPKPGWPRKPVVASMRAPGHLGPAKPSRPLHGRERGAIESSVQLESRAVCGCDTAQRTHASPDRLNSDDPALSLRFHPYESGDFAACGANQAAKDFIQLEAEPPSQSRQGFVAFARHSPRVLRRRVPSNEAPGSISRIS